MILSPTLQFLAADGRLASIPMRRYDTLEAANAALDTAVRRARGEGGTCLALRVETNGDGVAVYRWFDD